MRLKQFSLFIIGFLLALQSCTVEKRLHKRGYYVEWKSFRTIENKKVEKNELIELNLAIETTSTQIQTTTEEEEKIIKTPTETSFSETQEKYTLKKTHSESEKPNFETKNQTKSKNDFVRKIYLLHKKSSPTIEKEKNRLATVGYIMAITSIFIGFFTIPSLYVNAAALRQISKNPNRYNNRNKALIGYIISVLLTTLYFLIFGALLAAFIFNGVLPILYFGCLYLGILVSSLVIVNT